jgi:Holliday junction DNA helicase RuvA
MKDSGDNMVSLGTQDNTLRAEALSALVALGFAKVSVQKTLNRVLQAEKFTSVEQLIKVALKQLS